MPDCDIIFSNSSNNYKNVALVFKKDMFACQDSVLLDEFLFVKLLSFCHLPSFKLLILYREKNVLINLFRLLLILYNLSNQISFLVILMKIVYKKYICPRLQSEGFKQIVTEPTHIRGSLLDHIYIKYLWELSNKSSTKTVENSYSDHEWVNMSFEIDQLPNWSLINN